jgi:hypothetical protein
MEFHSKSNGRFKLITQCVTVTGTVLSINPQHDGETHFSLSLDPIYKNMVTKANFNSVMQGGIWSEMICQHPSIQKHHHKFDLSKEESVMDLMDRFLMSPK